jgi:hypothetical protein
LGYAKLKKYKVPVKLEAELKDLLAQQRSLKRAKQPVPQTLSAKIEKKKRSLVQNLNKHRKAELKAKKIKVEEIVKPCSKRKMRDTKTKPQPGCPAGKEPNPATGRCRTACKLDQIRNPKTGRCVKRTPSLGAKQKRKPQLAASKRKQKKKSCPAGQDRNPKTGRCRKACRPDQVRNPKTGRCAKRKQPLLARRQPLLAAAKQCPAGQERNPKTGRCRKACRPDQVRNPKTGRCMKKATVVVGKPGPTKKKKPSKQKPGPTTTTVAKASLNRTLQQTHPELTLTNTAAGKLQKMLTKVGRKIQQQGLRQAIGDTGLVANLTGDAPLESLAGEVFELAGNVALDGGRSKITNRDIDTALKMDEELAMAFK